MAISRAQLLKELVPGLHAIFGTEYNRYENEAAVLFEEEKSNRAFEEEVLFPGFGEASVKFVRSIAASTVAAAQYKAYVYDDPYCIFKIQSDQDTTALAATMVGNNVQIVASPSGSAVTHKSGMVVDSSTENTTQGFPFQFLGSAEAPDGSYTSAGTTMDILVKINTHLWGVAAGNTGLT